MSSFLIKFWRWVIIVVAFVVLPFVLGDLFAPDTFVYFLMQVALILCIITWLNRVPKTMFWHTSDPFWIQLMVSCWFAARILPTYFEWRDVAPFFTVLAFVLTWAVQPLLNHR